MILLYIFIGIILHLGYAWYVWLKYPQRYYRVVKTKTGTYFAQRKLLFLFWTSKIKWDLIEYKTVSSANLKYCQSHIDELLADLQKRRDNEVITSVWIKK